MGLAAGVLIKEVETSSAIWPKFNGEVRLEAGADRRRYRSTRPGRPGPRSAGLAQTRLITSFGGARYTGAGWAASSGWGATLSDKRLTSAELFTLLF